MFERIAFGLFGCFFAALGVVAIYIMRTRDIRFPERTWKRILFQLPKSGDEWKMYASGIIFVGFGLFFVYAALFLVSP